MHLISAAAIFVLISVSVSAADTGWKKLIRKDHPRLFLNADTLPAVKARALGAESALFSKMKAGLDAQFENEITTADHGARAAEAAFIFLVTGENRYRDLARGLLDASLRYYHQRFEKQQEVNWYSFSRINALAAYDWIYSSLPETDRKQIGASLLRAIQNEQPTRARKPFARENWLGPESGFYSTPSLLWYAGLALYRDGIDDAVADKFLRDGYAAFLKLLAYRRNAASDDGGSASGALNYSLVAYPWAEFNFFHTYKSATGQDIALQWPHMAYLPGYIFWNWLPQDGEFGYGDSFHTANSMPLRELNSHLSHLVHFYARSLPESASFAQWLIERTPREGRSTFPFTRFLLTAMPDVRPANAPEQRMPLARHFENVGQIFMRSGSGPDDTYALFTAGGLLEMHKHFDLNNFVIYKKGFLALDSGTRPEPGQHLTHYYCRTVAHNCMLIHMPGEQMPRYWGGPAPEEEPLPYPNDGGQQDIYGSKVAAFESHPDYAYVVGDATKAYNEKKCKLAIRQFVFLPPDHFVVFDRVTSTQPEYKKTWLLHTANEPKIEGDQFSADHLEGRLYCRTLLPSKAALTKVGGPGKQFSADGRNWPLPKGSRTPDTLPLLGQWRVEVSPQAAQTDDVFLHLIRAGDLKLTGIAKAKLIRTGKQVGVRFASLQNDYEVRFGTEGEPSGHIRLLKNGKLIVDRALTREVMRQSGIYGAQ